MGQYPINVRETPLTFLAGAAHKFNGPKGVGFLYMAAGTQSAPLIHGGAQERNMRGGTENVYGIVGLAKALELAEIGMDEKRAHVEDLKRYITQRLKEEFLGMCFNGDTEGNSLYTVINASFPPSDQGETLLMMLDIHGISCSAGSACSSGSDVGSHVLRALGHDMTRPALRFSFGKSNTRQEIDYTIGILKQVLQTDTVAVTA
jgi:cysteine desulfurase